MLRYVRLTWGKKSDTKAVIPDTRVLDVCEYLHVCTRLGEITKGVRGTNVT